MSGAVKTQSTGLTPLQEAFARGFALHGNGKKAYIDAGYSVKNKWTQYHSRKVADLLVHHDIAERIMVHRSRLSQRMDVREAQVMREIARCAFANPKDLLHDDGTLMPLSEIPRDVAASIKRVRIRQRETKNGMITETDVELVDKIGALRLLTDIKSLRDKPKPTVPVVFNLGDGATVNAQVNNG